jgi:TPR repeat protein
MIAASRLFARVRATLGAPDALYAVADMFAGRGAHARAFPLFVEAAQAGFHKAQYRLGRCYLLGLGVPISLGQALRWFRRAAEAGEVAAQTQLAELALQGVSDHPPSGLADDPRVASDFDRAEHWSRQAVAAGSGEAKALLAFILTDGPEERRDPAAGEALYRESAAAGWSRGQLGLALALLRDWTPESAAEARRLLREAASGGVAVAHYLLGMMTESGVAGDIDLPAAAAHYKTAADCGHVGAQVRYGFALLHGRGVDQDVFSAETWLRRAGLAGDAQAAAVVGYLYARDGDLPPNYAEAAMWLRRAAEAGHAAAARTLGRLLLIGQGLPKDIAEAVHWLRKAAEGGDEAARGDLLRLVVTRQLDADSEQAVIELLRAAADARDPEAAFELGLCFAQGIGVSQDGQAALALIYRAAEAGYPHATQLVAKLATEAEPS